MHLWESTSHVGYSIPLCFYLGWSAYLETMSKIRVWPYYNWYMTGGGGFLGGTLEWFQRSYSIVMSCLWCDTVPLSTSEPSGFIMRLFMLLYFWRVHRFIPHQNYMMLPLVLYPLPLLWLCIFYLRSPKGGCCSISDDLSYSFFTNTFIILSLSLLENAKTAVENNEYHEDAFSRQDGVKEDIRSPGPIKTEVRHNRNHLYILKGKRNAYSLCVICFKVALLLQLNLRLKC